MKLKNIIFVLIICCFSLFDVVKADFIDDVVEKSMSKIDEKIEKSISKVEKKLDKINFDEIDKYDDKNVIIKKYTVNDENLKLDLYNVPVKIKKTDDKIVSVKYDKKLYKVVLKDNKLIFNNRYKNIFNAKKETPILLEIPKKLYKNINVVSKNTALKIEDMKLEKFIVKGENLAMSLENSNIKNVKLYLKNSAINIDKSCLDSYIDAKSSAISFTNFNTKKSKFKIDSSILKVSLDKNIATDNLKFVGMGGFGSKYSEKKLYDKKVCIELKYNSNSLINVK